MTEKQKARWKKAGSVALNLAILAAVLYFIFHENYRDILLNLSRVEFRSLLPIIGAGLGYLALDAAACQVLLRSGLPGFTYREAVELTGLGVFCNVATFAAGTLPSQSIYLHHRGMRAGDSIGLLIMKYAVHKGAILVFAGVLLLPMGDSLRGSGLILLTGIGMGVSAGIVGVLLLLCTCEGARRISVWTVRLLPAKGKWGRRREALERNLNSLHMAARTLAGEKKRLWLAFGFNILKLVCMYSAAFLALRCIGESSLSWGSSVALASFSQLLSGVLPNVAGMGSVEASFWWAFSPFLDGAAVSSALVLYRFATYFFPFLVSIGLVVRVRARQNKNPHEKGNGD